MINQKFIFVIRIAIDTWVWKYPFCSELYTQDLYSDNENFSKVSIVLQSDFFRVKVFPLLRMVITNQSSITNTGKANQLGNVIINSWG